MASGFFSMQIQRLGGLGNFTMLATHFLASLPPPRRNSTVRILWNVPDVSQQSFETAKLRLTCIRALSILLAPSEGYTIREADGIPQAVHIFGQVPYAIMGPLHGDCAHMLPAVL